MSGGQASTACRLLLAVAFSLLLPVSVLTAQEPVRIVYVDMQRLIDSAPQVVQGRARLAREFAEADARLKLDQRRLAELEAALRTSSETDSAESGEQALEADALRRSIERSQQRLRDELASRVQQETDRAWPLIEEAVASYAREQGFDLVLQGPVLYASGRIDITDRVLERLRGGGERLP